MVKVGRVAYLNTLPLFYRWDADEVEIVEGHPSELVCSLRRGDLEAGIVSSVEYLKNKKDYRIVPGVCIASRKKACSVFIFSHRPLESVSTIYLSPASLTSSELTLYLLKRAYNNTPAISKSREEAEAVMLIGDEAISEKLCSQWRYVYDLGEEWYRLYQLPFVFALFLVRRDAPQWIDSFIAQQCQKSLKLFYEDLSQGKISIPSYKAAFVEEYFVSCLTYQLDEPALKSLELFESFLSDKKAHTC